MKTRALPIVTAGWLGTAMIAMVPLAGCDRDVSAVHAEKDAQGNTSVHVDGDKVDQNFDQAGKNFEQAGQQIKEGAQQAGEQIKEGAQQAGEQIQQGAQQAGDAIQRGAEQVQREVGPEVQEVLDDATVTAKVKAKLIADPEVTALHIDVDTVDGVVTLNGKVASADQKAEAEKLASHTEGVKKINNLIQVAGQPAPSVPAPPPAGGSQG